MSNQIDRAHRQERRTLKRENRRSPSEKYPMERSPLFKLGGPRELAALIELPSSASRQLPVHPSITASMRSQNGKAKIRGISKIRVAILRYFTIGSPNS